MSAVLTPEERLRALIKELVFVASEANQPVALGQADGDDETSPSYLRSVYHGLRAGRHAEELRSLSREELRELASSRLAGDVRHVAWSAVERLAGGSGAFLNDYNRSHLCHGLRHVMDEEDIHAAPPLLVGLEGALRDTLAAERRGEVPNPLRNVSDDAEIHVPKYLSGAEMVVKQLGVDKSYSAFVREVVYGGFGNSFRHGTAEGGATAQAVMTTLGVVTWFDAYCLASGDTALLS